MPSDSPLVYAALAVAIDRRVAEHPGVERLLPVAHYGIAVAFLTIAIPLKLHEHWITLAWLLEGALVFWVGASTGRRLVKLFAVVVFGLGLLRLLTLDLYNWGVQPPLFNARFATLAVAIAVLLWMIYLDYRSPHRLSGSTAMAAAVVVVNLLALFAAGMEIHDTFELRRRLLIRRPRGAPCAANPLRLLLFGDDYVLWCGADVAGLCPPVGTAALAGHSADRGNGHQGVFVRCLGTRSRLARPQLHYPGRSAAGGLLCLPARLDWLATPTLRLNPVG